MANSSLATGRTRFKRLFLIGTCSTYLATDALRLAVTEAKSDRDVSRYESAVRALAEVAPNDKEGSLDTEWVERMRRVTKAETDRLEQELRGYKNNLIKESIRVWPIFYIVTTCADSCRWVMKISDNIITRSETWFPRPRLIRV